MRHLVKQTRLLTWVEIILLLLLIYQDLRFHKNSQDLNQGVLRQRRCGDQLVQRKSIVVVILNQHGSLVGTAQEDVLLV